MPNIQVEPATLEDIAGWLVLAEEVEHLFGPMVHEPSFCQALRQAIICGAAFCIRQSDGTAAAFLAGGVVVDPKANEIAWLAVSARHRRRGCGRALLQHALGHLNTARPVSVTTFAASVPGGLPARMLYLHAGFRDAGPGKDNPAGIPTAVMVRE